MKRATIQFVFPVESVNRKMTLRKNTASSQVRYGEGASRVSLQKQVSRYMGAGTRSITRKGVGTEFSNYFFCRFNKRSTAVTSDEILMRNRFGFIATWVQATRKNLSIITQVIASYNNQTTIQGINPVGKTLYQFIFLVRSTQYDGGVTTTTDPAYNQWPS